MEATLSAPQATLENAAPIQPKPEMTAPVENIATTKSRDFIKSENNGVLRTLGTFIRTGAGEFFTWIGGGMMPAGISLAIEAVKKTGELKSTLPSLLTDPSFRESMVQNLGGKILENQLPDFLNTVTNVASVAFPGLGLGVSALGFLSSTVGNAIGWSGAKHGGEKVQTAYKIGKMAEFGTLALAAFVNPVFGALYPVAKGFSIATAFIGHTKRP